MYFWRTEHGAELDLLVVRNGRRIGFEIKRTAAPQVTPSMRSATQDLRLDALYVIHTGAHELSLGERVKGVPWRALRQLAAKVPH